ncbi:MAG: NUDIX domain-containing protein [Vulcanibacillus sp.]
MTSKLDEVNISSKTIFEGKVLKVVVDQVQLPNGNFGEREIVHHPGAVGILAVTADERVILIKQFRKAIDKVIIEIPAGKLEPNEDPIVCAFRELKEETGYSAESMKEITKIYTSPGYSDEVIHLFKAEGLINGKAVPDEDEFVEMLELSFKEIDDLINSDEIIDSKTIVALNYLKMM